MVTFSDSFHSDTWLRFSKAVEDNDIKQVITLLATKSLESEIIDLALFKASRYGHVQIVQLLIEFGTNVNHIFGLGTALTEVVDKENLQIINLLLEAGADCNLPDFGEVYPPLFIAIEKNNIEIVKKLVKAGASLDPIQDEGIYALEYAASYGHEDIFNFLYPLTNSELRLEAIEILPEGIKMREIEENADPLVCKLTSAVVDDDASEVKKLLDKNVNVNSLDDIGTTALWLAVRKQSVELVQLLLEAGANPNVSHWETGETPLMIVHNSSWRETAVQICSLLLEAGADVNAKDTERGKTVLMHNVGVLPYADEPFKANCRKIVQALLQYGADVNVKDREGNTALSIAREAGHDEIVQLLLDAGATEE